MISEFLLTFLFGGVCSCVVVVVLLRKFDKRNLIVSLLFPSTQPLDALPAYITLLEDRLQIARSEARSLSSKSNVGALLESESHSSKKKKSKSGRAKSKSKRRGSKASPYPDRECYVERRTGKVVRSWKSEYVVLREGWISLYSSPAREECYGHVHVEDCLIRTKSLPKSDVEQGWSGLALEHPSKDTIYNVRSSRSDAGVADDGSICFFNDWICVLRVKGEDQRNAFLADLRECVSPGSSMSHHDDIENDDNDDDDDDDDDGECEDDLFSQLRSTGVERTAEETQAMRLMVSRTAGRFDPQKHDDFLLMRFLAARNFSIDDASILFSNYVDWTQEYKPQEIDPTPLQNLIETGLAYLIGSDNNGLPTLLLRASTIQPKSFPEDIYVRYTVWIVEQCLKTLKPPGVTRMSVIVDFTGFGMSNCDYGLIKKQSFVMNEYYVELMATCYLVNAPFIVNGMWSVVKGWLDDTTRKKIDFCSKKKLLDHFPIDILPESLGGTATHEVKGVDIGLEKMMPELSRAHNVLRSTAERDNAALVVADNADTPAQAPFSGSSTNPVITTTPTVIPTLQRVYSTPNPPHEIHLSHSSPATTEPHLKTHKKKMSTSRKSPRRASKSITSLDSSSHQASPPQLEGTLSMSTTTVTKEHKQA